MAQSLASASPFCVSGESVVQAIRPANLECFLDRLFRQNLLEIINLPQTHRVSHERLWTATSSPINARFYVFAGHVSLQSASVFWGEPFRHGVLASLSNPMAMHDRPLSRSFPAAEAAPHDASARSCTGWARCSSNGEPLVLNLAEVTNDQQALVGGKGAKLSALIRAKLPVPPGFCLTTAAFRQFLDSSLRRDELSRLLAGLSAEQPEQLTERSAQIAARLNEMTIPFAVEQAVVASWRELGADLAFAVRSSATVEDAADHSFAGQFESFLNVRGEESLLAAVKACWLSLFSTRALAYQAREGLPAHIAVMAVVVQVMVPADAAGVLFTADPFSGNSGRMVIEAIPGLGDQLVSGRVNPESIVLDRGSLNVTERRPVSTTSCLGDLLARRIGELGLQAERLFKDPQDLEWAVCDGQAFLLQSRPITTLRAPSIPAPLPACSVSATNAFEVWTNANVMEALPEVVTPLSWSLMEILLSEFLNPLMGRLGLQTGPPPLIDLIAGRAYLNVGAIVNLVTAVGPIRVNVASLFGGEYAHLEQALPQSSTSPRSCLRLSNLGRSLRQGAWLLPGLFRQQRKIMRWGDVVFGELSRTPPERLTDAQLGGHPRALLRLAGAGEGESTWAAAAWMAIGGVGGAVALYALTRRWLKDDDGSLANRLLAGAGNMDSAENGLALCRLADWARNRPPVAQALRTAKSFTELQRQLQTTASGAEFLECWYTFMLNHGHQARGGMDMAQPRWSENPDHVLDLVRACLEVPETANPLKLQAQRLAERAQLIAECRQRLRNPLKTALIRFLIRTSQRGLTQRENVKNAGVRLVAILRRAMLEAGKRLKQRGLIQAPQEVFFLKLEELEAVLSGHDECDVGTTVAERKAEHTRLTSLEPPSTIVGRYDPAAPPANITPPGTRTMQGVGVSPGVVTGMARVILQADAQAHVLPGEILVAPYTDPGWTPYFLPAAGIVVDVGGLLSHGSVVAREYGLPAVVNVGPATRFIRTGDRLEVDGNRGRVTILERARNR